MEDQQQKIGKVNTRSVFPSKNKWVDGLRTWPNPGRCANYQPAISWFGNPNTWRICCQSSGNHGPQCHLRKNVFVYEDSFTWTVNIEIQGKVPAQLQGNLLYTYGKEDEFNPSTTYSFSAELEGGVKASSVKVVWLISASRWTIAAMRAQKIKAWSRSFCLDFSGTDRFAYTLRISYGACDCYFLLKDPSQKAGYH